MSIYMDWSQAWEVIFGATHAHIQLSATLTAFITCCWLMGVNPPHSAGFPLQVKLVTCSRHSTSQCYLLEGKDLPATFHTLRSHRSSTRYLGAYTAILKPRTAPWKFLKTSKEVPFECWPEVHLGIGHVTTELKTLCVSCCRQCSMGTDCHLHSK